MVGGRWRDGGGLLGAGSLVVVSSMGACTEPNPYLFEPSAASSTGMGTSSGTDVGGRSSSGADSSSSVGSDTGPLGCVESGRMCTDAAPEGWSGPFAWREAPFGDAGVVCLAPWDRPLTEAYSDIVAPAARCGCECGSLLGAVCGGGTVTYHFADGCAGGSDPPLELQPGCNDAMSPWAIEGSFSFEPPTVVEGSCTPQPIEELEPAGFLRRHLACASETTVADCGEGRQCVPVPEDPYLGGLCIWAEGDLACPEQGPYVEAQRLFRDVDDGRGCLPCECALPRGACTRSSLLLANSAGCMGTSAGSVPRGGCTNGVGGDDVEAVSHDPGVPPSGECTPSVVSPTGAAVGREPLTFCCTR